MDASNACGFIYIVYELLKVTLEQFHRIEPHFIFVLNSNLDRLFKTNCSLYSSLFLALLFLCGGFPDLLALDNVLVN